MQYGPEISQHGVTKMPLQEIPVVPLFIRFIDPAGAIWSRDLSTWVTKRPLQDNTGGNHCLFGLLPLLVHYGQEISQHG